MSATGIIKLFQYLRATYEFKGIYSTQSDPNHGPNGRVRFILISHIIMFVSSLAFLIFKARSIGEQTFSYYETVTLLFCLVYTVLHAEKIPEMLSLIEEFEEFIRKSK